MKVLKIFALFRVVCAVLLGVAFLLIPHERILTQALERIETTTGRKIEVTGGSQIILFPNLGVVASDVRVFEGAAPSPLGKVTADELTVSVNTMALLGREIELNKLALDGADIFITPNASQEAQKSANPKAGEGEDDGAHSPSDNTASFIENFSFEAIELTNSTLQFATGGKTYALSDLNAEVLPIQETAGLRLGLNAIYQKQPFELQLEVPSLKNLLDAGESVTAALNAEFGRFSAVAQNPLSDEVIAEVEANIENMAGLLSVLDVPSRSWPSELGNTLNVSTKVTVSGDAVRADDIQVGFSDNRIMGQLRSTLSEIPTLSGALNLGSFSYGAKKEAGQSGSSFAEIKADGSQGWSNAPLALPELDFLNANVDLKATSLSYGPYRLSDFVGNVIVENGVLRADIERVSAFGGALNGQLRIRGGSAQSVAGDAKGTDLWVEQLLTTFANRDDVKGTMSADASFTTAGKSIAQFMKSLDGKGQFNITEGRYDGLDLDQIFRSGQVQSGTTLFDEALASYVINAGTLSNSDLLVTIPDGELRGEGTINLGSQALDYLLTPKSLNT